jgi:uncharacterized glyoxalase superfamily protein PhnB
MWSSTRPAAQEHASRASRPRRFWGGYSGVFVDPDGHPWEVAHNPHWTVRDDGSVNLNG